MKRRNFLIGTGGIAVGSGALLGSGAFSRVESHRDVTIEVAADPDAYLGLSGTGSANSDNYVDLDENGHLEVDIGENPSGGEGVNSDSFTWFDSMIQVCNQGKAAVGFWLVPPTDDDFPEGIDATGPDGTPFEDEPRLQFYTGEAAGSQGDDGTTTVMGVDNAVAIPVGECLELGVRTMTKGVSAADSDQLFGDEVVLTADVDVEGELPGGEETRFDLPEFGQAQFDLLTDVDLTQGNPETGETESIVAVELAAEDEEGEPLDDEQVDFGVTVTDHLGTDPFDDAPNDSLSGPVTVEFEDGQGSFTIGGADRDDADLTLGFFGFLPEVNDVETIQTDPQDQVDIVGRWLELDAETDSTAASGAFTNSDIDR